MKVERLTFKDGRLVLVQEEMGLIINGKPVGKTEGLLPPSRSKVMGADKPIEQKEGDTNGQ